LGLRPEAFPIADVALLSPKSVVGVGLLLERRSVLQQFLVLVVAPDAFDFSKPLSRDAAYKRLAMGQESLDYLLANYDAIVTQGGGDNVRRYLGTVGTTSGLWGMSKVLNYLKDDAEDNIMEFTEAKTEFESAIAAADGSAYMAIFVTTSTSAVPPEKYFADAKREAVLAKKYLVEIAELLGGTR
jgi:hypothetical protein